MLRMDPGTPTSFIPKRPVTSEPVSVDRSSSRTIGIFSLITFVIVVGTAISYAGVYLWEKQLLEQKKSLGDSIGQAQNEIGSDFLEDMKRLNDRIAGVRSLIKTHVVITPIFEALQNSTLRSVQYKTFGYTLATDSLTKDQTVIVTLTGTAKTYSTIALQSDAFKNEALIRNPVFSGLTINDKTGTVDFKLVFDVDIKDLSFEAFVKELQKDTVPAEAIVETQT